MRKLYANLFWLNAFLFSSIVLRAQPVISYSTVTGGLSAPVEVVNAGDGSNRLFIVQQSGAVRIYDPATNTLLTTPFMNISPRIVFGGERGLLSIAFHPAYETNGYLFAYYNRAGDGNVTLSRFQVSASPNVADTSTRVELITIPKPFFNHNGGHLQFGSDGHLYLSTGDGGSANDPGNRAQDSTSLLGKILRINVDNFDTPPYYTVPTSNPFYNTPNFDNRIWARGLRNPYRWSFDRLTGDMWIGDVGQDAKEEINYRPGSSTGGENYGWRCFEGSIRNPNSSVPACDAPGYVPPVFDYNKPSGGNSSVIGGYVYRGSQYGILQGYYLATDYFSGNLYMLKPNGSGGFTSSVQPSALPTSVTGFGEGEDGALYVVGNNTLYRITVLPPLPVTLSGFTGKRTADGAELKWTTASEQNLAAFEIQYSGDGSNFATVGRVAASGNAAGSSYSFVHRHSFTNALHYRLRTAERDGGASYSSVVKMAATKSTVQIYPTTVRAGKLFIQTGAPLRSLQLSNGNGSVVFRKTFASAVGQIEVQLPPLPKGVYMATVIGKTTAVQKLLIE